MICILSVLILIGGTFFCSAETDPYELYGVTFRCNLDDYETHESPMDIYKIMCAVARSGYDEDELMDVYGKLGFGDIQKYQECTVGKRTTEYGRELYLIDICREDDLPLSDLSFEEEEGGYRRISAYQIGAEDVMESLTDYLGSAPKPSNKRAYLVTGFKGGAGVANLFTKDLIDLGCSAKGYCYGCPNTILRTEWGETENGDIYNINACNDMFTFLPGAAGAAMAEIKDVKEQGTYDDPYEILSNYNSTYYGSRFGKDMQFNDGLSTSSVHGIERYFSVLSGFDIFLNDAAEFEGKEVDIYILGPADLTVYDPQGGKAASVTGGNTEYYGGSFGRVVVNVFGEMKSISFSEKDSFKVCLTGAAEGAMDYVITKRATQSSSANEVKVYRDVKLKEGKTFAGVYGTSFSGLEDRMLYVTDENGTPTANVHDDGMETPIGVEYGKCGDNLTWTLSDGILTITGEGDMYNYNLLFERSPWYSKAKSIREVRIEHGVTGIGGQAFTDLGITSVEITDTVVDIGPFAFYDCDKLKKVTIPDTVKKIGQAAFKGCDSLKEVSVAPDIRDIGGCAFRDTPWEESQSGFVVINDILMAYHGNAAHVTVPDGIIEINDFAFSRMNLNPSGMYIVKYNTSLKSVKIPDTVTRIGESAFGGCSLIKSMDLPSSIKEIDDDAFSYCEKLAGIDIPEGVKKLGDTVFGSCSSITRISIPASLEEMGIACFMGCTSLKTVDIPPENDFLVCVDGVIYSKDMTDLVCCLPAVYRDTYQMPDTVTTVRMWAFYECSRIKNIKCADGIKRLEEETFFGCTALESITLPSDLEYIDNHVFADCRSIQSLVIPEGVVDLIGFPFTGMTDLTAVEIPKGVTIIWEGAFNGDKNLRDVYFTGTKEQWNKRHYRKEFEKDNITIHFESHMPSRKKIDGAKTSAVSNKIYTGKYQKPDVKVTLSGKALKKDTDYILDYSNNKNVGRAEVHVLGIGKYTGKITIGFNIKPKAVKLVKVTSGKRYLKAKWKKGAGITGYEIQYGLKKSFRRSKTVTVKKRTVTSKKIKKLKSRKKYYVRVRAYKKIGKKKYVSAWSRAKTVKTK